MDAMLKANPGQQRHRHDEVKQPFVRNGKDDKEWSEGEECNYNPVQIVVPGVQRMQEWDKQRYN